MTHVSPFETERRAEAANGQRNQPRTRALDDEFPLDWRGEESRREEWMCRTADGAKVRARGLGFATRAYFGYMLTNLKGTP